MTLFRKCPTYPFMRSRRTQTAYRVGTYRSRYGAGAIPVRGEHAHACTNLWPPWDQPLTSICTCACIVDAQQRREARLSRRREVNCGLTEELCFGKCRRKRSMVGEAEKKGQSSASCTAQREEALQRRTASDLRVKHQRRGRFVEESVNGGIVLWKVQKMQLPSTSHKALLRTLDAAASFVGPHMRGHEQHPQTRSGSPHNACISLVLNIYDGAGTEPPVQAAWVSQPAQGVNGAPLPQKVPYVTLRDRKYWEKASRESMYILNI